MTKKRIRQTISSNNDIAQKRFDRYYNVLYQYNNAVEKGFYIEAITLMESLLSDRLESLLNQLGSTSEYSFLPLGNLLSALKKYRTLSEFEEIINKLDDWRKSRNHAIHEMAKISDSRSFQDDYSVLKGFALEGYELFKQLNTKIMQFRAPALKRRIASTISKEQFEREYHDYSTFLNQNGYLVDEFEILIPVRWFRNEMQPTKSYLEGNRVYVNNKYLKTGDISAWLIHELGHLYFYQKRGRVLDKEYPNNLEERFAFGLQFLYCKTKKVPKDELLNGICSCYPSQEAQKYRRVFEKLWDAVNYKYIQKLIENNGRSRKSLKSRRH